MESNESSPKPPPGHENTLNVLRQAFKVPKAEIERREAQWRADHLHSDRPKGRQKRKPPAE